MKTLLDVATVDGKDLASKSVAVRAKLEDPDKVVEYFVRKRFRNLYRAQILRTRGRTPSTRECDLALEEAQEEAQDG